MFLDVRMSSEPTARWAELLVLPVLVAAAPLYLCDIRCGVAGQARVTDTENIASLNSGNRWKFS